MKNSLLTLCALSAAAYACTPAPSNNNDNNTTFGSDSGTPGNTDAGHTVDAGHGVDAGHPTDAGQANTDAGPEDAGPPPLVNCGSLVGCDNGCTSQACADSCAIDATDAGNMLYNTVGKCINSDCPSTSVCKNQNSTACNNCVTASQQADGGCFTSINNCFEDMSGALSCYGIFACIQAYQCTSTSCEAGCTTSATAQAQMDFLALNNCLNTACPQTSGGVCASDTTACQNCVNTATMTGACATDQNNCNSD